MQNEEPKDKQENDLYLKGQNYYSGEAINFDEKIKGEGHAGDGDYGWRLTVYKSLDFELGEISGGDGRDYGDDKVSCGSGTFGVTKWTMKGGEETHWAWEKAIS